VVLGATAHLHLCGKGRKERTIPLWRRTARVLMAWLSELAGPADGPVFPNARGAPLTRDGVAYILEQAVETASAGCPSLLTKRVSPHVVRHTTAMHLLQAGVDPAVIALWLGHERLETTHIYVEADLAMKERVLAKLAPAGAPARRLKPDDALMAFLAAL
jgi:site-specific recombinase XerD